MAAMEINYFKQVNKLKQEIMKMHHLIRYFIINKLNLVLLIIKTSQDIINLLLLCKIELFYCGHQ